MRSQKAAVPPGQARNRALGASSSSPELFGHNGDDLLMLGVLCLTMVVTGASKARIFYQYQVDVPLASIRYHLRHVLQRRLLRLQFSANELHLNRNVSSKHVAARLTPGERGFCVACSPASQRHVAPFPAR